jgi:hypothetical protein
LSSLPSIRGRAESPRLEAGLQYKGETPSLLLLLFMLLLSLLATGAELVVGPGLKAGLKAGLGPKSRELSRRLGRI